MSESTEGAKKSDKGESNVEIKNQRESKVTETSEIDLVEIEAYEIRSCPLFLSQFGWLFFVFFFIACGFIFPRCHPSQKFKSKSPSHPWNSKEIPRIFTHVTDIHIAKAEPFKIVNTRLLVQTMKFYNPNFHLISGDMVDNYGKKNWPKIGRQIKEDWDIFKSIIDEELEGQEIVDVAGNHDMWGVTSPLSDTNLYLDYSYTFNRTNTLTDDEFYCKKIVKDNITFVLINNYKFPTIHPPYIYWAHPSREMLDRYESVIENAGNCTVVMHYPTDHNWWIRSSKGHTFEQIMQSKNIEHIFSGHFHPVNPIVLHHMQGGVEYVGIGAYQFKGFALVTIDNDRLVYHSFRLYELPPKFFMTHPVPNELLSSHVVFNELNTEIRILSYAKKNVTLVVSGAVNGTMKYAMTLENGADIYSYPLNLPFGEYTITVTGDGCNITRTFTIGEEYQGKKEPMVLLQRGMFFAKVSSIPVYIALFIMLFPLNILTFPGVEEWIQGKSGDSHWIAVILFGPILVRKRILNLPKPIRYTLFGLLLYPLIFPNHFFKPIHGLNGYSFLCFVNIGGYIFYDEWALHMTYFYILTILFPHVIFVSGSKFKNKSWVYLCNQILMYTLLAGICIVNYRWVGEAVVWPLLFVNPTFIVIPIIMQILIYFFIYNPRKKI